MSADEIKALSKNYHDMRHEVNGLRQDNANIQKSLQRIEFGLFGDDDLAYDGFVKRLEDYKEIVNGIKQTVEDVRIKKEKEDAKLTVHKWWITGVASMIGGGIMWIINYIFK